MSPRAAQTNDSGAVQSPSSRSRITALDGIRGIAVLIVVFHHGLGFAVRQAATPFEKVIFRISQECWIGVDLFFVLSGYLITRILLERRGRPGYFKHFYVRRALRIFPLYYAFVFLFCFVLPQALPAHAGFSQLWHHQLWYWFYLPSVMILRTGDWYSDIIDHTWSLAIEEQFYLLWPLGVALLSRRRIIGAGVGAFLACLVVRLGMAYHGFSNAATRVFTPAHCDGLMLGGALAALELEGVSTAVLRRISVAAVVIGVGLRVSAGTSLVAAKLAWDAIGSSAFGLIFFGAIAATRAFPSSWWTRFLSLRPLGFFGTYSYAFYLFQQPLLVLFSPLVGRQALLSSTALANWVSNLVLLGGASLLLAYASFHLFERRFLALKVRFE